MPRRDISTVPSQDSAVLRASCKAGSFLGCRAFSQHHGDERQGHDVPQRASLGALSVRGHYTGGDFQVFRIRGDGSIGVMTDNFASVGNGTGPDPDRQEGPHAHQLLTDRDGNHVFGVDLGADKVNAWNLDPGTGKLVPNTVPFAPIASGSGLRHMSFHPTDSSPPPLLPSSTMIGYTRHSFGSRRSRRYLRIYRHKYDWRNPHPLKRLVSLHYEPRS